MGRTETPDCPLAKMASVSFVLESPSTVTQLKDFSALAAIAAKSTAVVPVAGVVRNYNTLLGQDGIVGLKTGSMQAAGGCVVIAAWHQTGARNTLIVAATFGQPGTAQTILPNALHAGHMLVLALDRALGHSSVTGP